MGKREKRAYLEAIRGRYRKSDRAGKAAILDEFCAICGFNRKYAIRLLGKPPGRTGRKPGKKPVYGSPELLAILKTIWLATDQMRSKKLKAAIPLWLPHFEAEYGPLEAGLKALLLRLSAATIDRLLKAAKTQVGKKGLCGTKPGTLLKNQIPLKTHHWDITQPGFMEADTVAHCGNSLAGNFVWSLTLTDIHSSWTECRAVWNKGAVGIVAQIRDIEAKLPFTMQGFDCDNGSEFLNHYLLRYTSLSAPSSSPAHVPTRKTTMLMWSRKTGAMSGSYLAMIPCSDRVTARDYGEAYPVANNDTAASRQLNRRVETILSDDKGNIAPR